MQKQYEAIVAQNKSLQSELRLANKMIELMAIMYEPVEPENYIEMMTNRAIKELGE